MSSEYEQRRMLAARIRASRAELANHITEEFLEQHPDWEARYGQSARVRGEEDAAFHLDFLAGALLSSEPSPFENYAVWTRGVLTSRGIGGEFLVENLRQVQEHVGPLLGDPDGPMVEGYVAAGIRAIEREESGVDDDRRIDLPPKARSYLEAVLEGDRRTAVDIVLEAVRDSEVLDVYASILMPTQHEIGRLWARAEISVATEHLATAVTQYAVARLYPHLDVPESTRGRAVVTGVEGDLHQLGAHMVADTLEHDGWDVRFLGSHLPSSHVLREVEASGASLLAVSATVLPSVTGVAEMIEEARRRFGDALRIVVGGRAFGAGSWEEMGADGLGHTLADAVELARKLSA